MEFGEWGARRDGCARLGGVFDAAHVADEVEGALGESDGEGDGAVGGDGERTEDLVRGGEREGEVVGEAGGVRASDGGGARGADGTREGR